MRRGFTLVEVLVALVLLEIAMLALAGTTALAARDLASAHRSVRARTLARNRLEIHRARACPAAATGTATYPGGFTEHWSIEAVGLQRRLTVTVEYPLPRGRDGRIALTIATLCSAPQ